MLPSSKCVYNFSGPISHGQVLTVNPFGNTVEMISLKGVHVRAVMEHSVANYDPLDPSGRFLQVSGITIYELRHVKTNVLVSDLVRHKPGCTATEDS